MFEALFFFVGFVFGCVVMIPAGILVAKGDETRRKLQEIDEKYRNFDPRRSLGKVPLGDLEDSSHAEPDSGCSSIGYRS